MISMWPQGLRTQWERTQWLLGRIWALRQWASAAAGVLVVALFLGLFLRVTHDTPTEPEPGRIVWSLFHEPDDDAGDDGTRPVAFLYCHAVGPARHAAWLEAKQAAVRVNRSAADEWIEPWSQTRCLGAAPLALPEWWNNWSAVIAQAPDIVQVLGALPRATLEATWAPRVTRLFVDARGDLYVRLVLYDPRARGLVARVVLVRAILQLLDAYRVEVRTRLAGVSISRGPCICPLHLGIVGSGMHFTQENDFCRTPYHLSQRRPLLRKLMDERGPNPYRILFGVRELHDEGAATTSIELNFSETAHPFPASVDAVLWPRRAGQPRHVSVAATNHTHFGAYDPLPLWLREVVESVDLHARRLKEPHPLDDQVTTDGAASEADWRKALGQTAVRPLDMRKLILGVSLEQVKRDLWTESTTTGLQTPRCIAHCEALENHVLAVPDEPRLAIAAPAMAVDAGGTGNDKDVGDDDADDDDDVVADAALVRQMIAMHKAELKVAKLKAELHARKKKKPKTLS